jgi:hypothetical protein
MRGRVGVLHAELGDVSSLFLPFCVADSGMRVESQRKGVRQGVHGR